MAWKCDKCKNIYDNSVKPMMHQGFAFCPRCMGTDPSVQPIKKRANYRKIITAILIAALITLVGAIVSCVMLFIADLIPAAVTAATCGLATVVILSSVAETIRKRNKDFIKEDDKKR